MSLERRIGGARDSLIFPSPEEANEFQESFDARVRTEKTPGATRKRELVSEELVKVFEKEGVAVTPIREPWEHTPQEHAEVQKLVEVAFASGLDIALKQAHESASFPRNIDLLHDVLTGKLYEAVVVSRVNVHHPSPLVLIVLLLIVVGIMAAIVLFAYSI
ncbi:MAG TPA: hypothetical protein VLG69_04365 [Candidatus Andersenbacteria bacterium]|nr:hypothetical protein [Candidatus Andersenbacteria bacterium]